MLSTLLDRLEAATTSFAVIAEAPSLAALTTVDAAAASAALKTLLQAAVGKVYAIEIPEGKVVTDASYRLVSARPVEVGGVRVLTAVTFVVTVRAASYAALMTAQAAIETQVAASLGAISILDAMQDFEPVKNHYLVAMEMQYAVPAVPAESGSDWPALLVDAVDYTGDPAGAELWPIRQRVGRRYRFIILDDSNSLATLRLELQNALLGWQQQQADHPFHFVEGSAVSLPGGLYGWADTYSDSTYINQPT